jgi:hypothetical protein
MAWRDAAIAKPGHQATNLRDRLRRNIEPLWPVPALTPFSECPHGVSIEPGWICGVCYISAEPTQIAIDRMPTPPPTNPEVRLAARIGHLKQWLADHPDASDVERLWVRRRILELDFEYRKWIGTTYRRRADLKGGHS